VTKPEGLRNPPSGSPKRFAPWKCATFSTTFYISTIFPIVAPLQGANLFDVTYPRRPPLRGACRGLIKCRRAAAIARLPALGCRTEWPDGDDRGYSAAFRVADASRGPLPCSGGCAAGTGQGGWRERKDALRLQGKMQAKFRVAAISRGNQAAERLNRPERGDI